MSTNATLILTGILCLSVFNALADDGNISKFNKFICTVHDKALVVNSSCRAKPVSRSQTLLNLYGYLTYPVNITWVHIRLYKKYNVYKPFLVNVRENFCKYFTNKSGLPYVHMLMGIVAQYTNLNHTCPYKGDILFKNVPMDANRLRNLWPSGEYRVDVDAYANTTPAPFVTLQVYLEMKEKN